MKHIHLHAHAHRCICIKIHLTAPLMYKLETLWLVSLIWTFCRNLPRNWSGKISCEIIRNSYDYTHPYCIKSINAYLIIKTHSSVSTTKKGAIRTSVLLTESIRSLFSTPHISIITRSICTVESSLSEHRVPLQA